MRIEGLQSTKDKWRILESSGDGLCGIAGIMADQTLVDLEQPTVPVCVLNLSEEEQRIKSGVAIRDMHTTPFKVPIMLHSDSQHQTNYAHHFVSIMGILKTLLEVAILQ